jgi:radical SAM superfamily enzyme YgiQ (UPF0313 family)
MKIGFVNQNISPRLNLGLAYIMTMANQNHQVYLWDVVGKYKYFEQYLKKEIEKKMPEIIGFSVNNYTFRSAVRWAKLIRNNFPKIKFIFGGVFPTIEPLECLSYHLVDMVCIGEGEYTIVEILDRLERGKKLNGVKGLWFKDQTGNIIKNDLRPFIKNIDTLPFPDWDLWDIENYIKKGGLIRNSLKVVSSRGCPHNCKFCTAPVIRKSIPGTYYRLHSPEIVIAKIEYFFKKYKQMGLKYISFADPYFGGNLKHFSRLMQLYKESGLASSLPWIAETRPEIVSKEWAKKAGDSGAMVISLGVESLSNKIRRDIMGKNINNSDIYEAIENLENNKILYIIYLILCTPEETPKSFLMTLRFSLKINSVKTYYLFYLPLPRTSLFAEHSLGQVVHSDTRFDDGFWNKPNVRLKNINKLEFVQLNISLIFCKIISFLKKGWQLRQAVFFKDILLHLMKKNTALPFSNPYFINELYQNTVLKYFLEDQTEIILKKSNNS